MRNISDIQFYYHKNLPILMKLRDQRFVQEWFQIHGSIWSQLSKSWGYADSVLNRRYWFVRRKRAFMIPKWDPGEVSQISLTQSTPFNTNYVWRFFAGFFITQVQQNVTKIVLKPIWIFGPSAYASFQNYWLFDNSLLKRTCEKSPKALLSILHCWEPSWIWSRPA